MTPTTTESTIVTSPLSDNKRHSVPGTSGQSCEPIHMTLQEVRQFLHSLYSSASDSSSEQRMPPPPPVHSNRKHKKNTFAINIKNRKSKECVTSVDSNQVLNSERIDKSKKPQSKSSFSCTLKQTLCNLFRFRRPEPPPDTVIVLGVPRPPPFSKRALPPLPISNQSTSGTDSFDLLEETEETNMDFASSIEKVKDVSSSSVLLKLMHERIVELGNLSPLRASCFKNFKFTIVRSIFEVH